MTLSASQLEVLGLASRSAVLAQIGNIRRYWTFSRWLSRRNRYAKDPVERINLDKAGAWNPSHSQLADYVAGSTIPHCFDGWSYLARALEAEIAGDPDAARHLGYYAELRAAMALLAAEGIGVFNSKHVIVDASGRCHCLAGMRTHEFAWAALEWWSGTPAAATRIQSAIKPGGVSLGDWLRAYPGSANFISEVWLQQWGLDLSRIADDRDARNQSSYRPTAFTSPGPTQLHKTVEAILGFWEVCEPDSQGGFPVLDRHLLRTGIELIFQATHDRTRTQSAKRFKNDVTAMLHGVAPAEPRAGYWLEFLSSELDNEPLHVITNGAAKDGPDHPLHSKQVIARATLLLRLATGSVGDLLREAGVHNGNELSFWWSSAQVRRRLWDGVEIPQPDRLSDLWGDVEEAKDGIRNWLASAPAPSYQLLLRDRPQEALVLGTAERVALWGLHL